jgi:membrane-bound lytic murein transglycosylase B
MLQSRLRAADRRPQQQTRVPRVRRTNNHTSSPGAARRAVLRMAAASLAALVLPRSAGAKEAQATFDEWVAAFQAKALAHGIAAETYARVMSGLKPDRTGLTAIHEQPEFNEQLWQYLNRRVSDWRIIAGRQKAQEYAALLKRIERDYGVAPSVMLGVWGVESTFGDPLVQRNHMRPVIPSLATLAWGEPRRRGYWESELINAVTIVQNGWSAPAEMNGSWAGAMGHTQWMPEVWLHLGVDYDGDGKISPFGRPDDALATTARYFVERGNYRRGEAWGYEVRAPAKAGGKKSRRYAEWQKQGVVRADGKAYPLPNATAKLWVPVPGGPAFLLGPNFHAVHAYNPSMNYTLAIVHLGDRCTGGEPFVQSFPGSEPPPTLAEVQEIQRRLTALGFDTGGADGRAGTGTMLAVQAYQRKVGMNPADGYAGIKLLARLRQEP